MSKLIQDRGRRRIGRALARIAAALMIAAAIYQPGLAHAGPHGGGGFHGGGGGFRGSGFHAGSMGAFHGGGFHGGFAGLHHSFEHTNDGHWDHGWHNGRYGRWWGGAGLGWTYYANPWGGYPDSGYYDYDQPYASHDWYYCPDPAGYYPYVTQCSTTWQTVPAS